MVVSGQQAGPSWYPSKQFVHSPEPPTGAPRPPVDQPAGAGRTPASSGPVRRFLDRFLRRT